MKRAGWLWWWAVLAGGLWAEAPALGTFETEVSQGGLDRVAWWYPGDGAEGRWWWEPSRGGSGWVRVGDFQAGPLVGSEASGVRTWGPGTRLAPGRWGLAYLGPWAGAWAVQDPGWFEAGGQARFPLGPWTLAAGGDRTWVLGGPEPGGTDDRGRAGFAWTIPGTGVSAQASGGRGQGGTWWEGEGQARYSRGPWSAEVRGSWPSRGPWNLLVQAGWERWGWDLGGSWDREGPTVRASVRGSLGALTMLGGTQVSVDADGPAVRGRVSVGGRTGDGLWNLGWSGRPGVRGLVQETKASWTQGPFGAEASWQVAGWRLGWFGPGGRFDLTLRWKV